MRERHHHDMPRRIGIRIQHDVTVLAAVYDAGSSIVPCLGEVAKDTAGSLRACGDIGVTPGRPKIVHRTAEYQMAASFGTRTSLVAPKVVSALDGRNPAF